MWRKAAASWEKTTAETAPRSDGTRTPPGCSHSISPSCPMLRGALCSSLWTRDDDEKVLQTARPSRECLIARYFMLNSLRIGKVPIPSFDVPAYSTPPTRARRAGTTPECLLLPMLLQSKYCYLSLAPCAALLSSRVGAAIVEVGVIDYYIRELPKSGAPPRPITRSKRLVSALSRSEIAQMAKLRRIGQLWYKTNHLSSKRQKTCTNRRTVEILLLTPAFLLAARRTAGM